MLADLAGHQEQRAQLRRAVDAGRVASCYLFVGPDGVGKTTMARWFARLLSCTAAERPCGRCGRCGRLAEGSSPDLTVFEDYGHPYTLHASSVPGYSLPEIDAALAALHEAGLLAAVPRGIGEARICQMLGPDCTSSDPEGEVSAALKGHEMGSLPALLARRMFLRGAAVRYPRSLGIKLVRDYVLRQVVLRPVEMNYRLFLLDDAHKMPPEAQNALLKTLEEPPPSSVLVLVSSSPNRILPTIVSRCQKVVLRGLAQEPMRELLRGLGASEADARLSAELSDGSVLRALDFDPAEHRLRRDALLEALTAGGERTQRVQALVRSLGVASTTDRQERHRSMAKQLGLMLELLRDALALAAGSGPEILRHGQCSERLEALARLGVARLSRTAEVALETLERFNTNASGDLQAMAAGSRLYDALAGAAPARP